MSRMTKWFWTVVVMAVMCGCTKTEYITVERVTHDTRPDSIKLFVDKVNP